MKLYWAFPGWGWKMYGIGGKDNSWFLGYSKRTSLVSKELLDDVLRSQK